jgi:Cd2+/Zn2+-exporting ATPase
MEQLAKVQVVALDKTGTLTEGRPDLTAILSARPGEENQLVQLAAGVEQGSHHPLASAIVRHAESLSLTLPNAVDRQALPGMGVQGIIDGALVKIVAPSDAPSTTTSFDWRRDVERLEAEGQTVVVVVRDDDILGLLALQDTVRPDAAVALRHLQALGIDSVMLTGDNSRAAQAIANRLGVRFQAGLLPQDKVKAVDILQREAPTAMIGDGINDAPAMRAATLGIAMGSGTDVALETAYAALTHNRLTGLASMIALARRTRTVIHQNITLSLGLKGIFLLTSLLGLTGLWVAILADSGATVLVTFNALRLLRKTPLIPTPTQKDVIV